MADEPITLRLTEAEQREIGYVFHGTQWLSPERVECIERIIAARLSTVEAERDRYIELLAACPRNIEGHVCCDCQPTCRYPQRVGDCLHLGVPDPEQWGGPTYNCEGCGTLVVGVNS